MINIHLLISWGFFCKLHYKYLACLSMTCHSVTFFYIKWFSSAFSEGGKVTKYQREKGYWMGI